MAASPPIYSLTRAACKDLQLPYKPRELKPHFLAHEVQIRDFKVWLALVQRAYHHQGLTEWKTGSENWVKLERTIFPKELRPDATFCFHLSEKQALSGWLEVDRGTERGTKKWQEKVTAYQSMLEVRRGRVLIIASTPSRTQAIKKIIEQTIPPSDRYWLTERSTLEDLDLSKPLWWLAGNEIPQPLIRKELLQILPSS